MKQTPAYKLAAEGYTNAEIFAKLEYSSGELKRRLRVEHELMFAIVLGRRAFCQPHFDALVALALGGGPLKIGAQNAIMSVLERMDKETKTLTIGYDMALLEQLPGVVPTSPMEANKLTAALRATK